MEKMDKENMEKVVIITGASGGIGFATAKLFAQNGYKVVGISKAEFSSEYFEHYYCDITDTESVKKIFEQVEQKYGRIDILINNAGLGISGAIEFADKKDIDLIFDVNIKAVIEVSKIAIPYLRKTKGKILNTSSVAAQFAIPFQACYSATKSAIETFSLALANELRLQGIKVCCIRPGDTKTTFTANRIKNETTSEFYNDRINKSVKKMEKDEQQGDSPLKVAKLFLKVAKKKNPPLIASVDFVYKLLGVLEKILPKKFVNWIVYKMY